MNIIFNSLLAQLIKYDVHTTRKIKSIHDIFYHILLLSCDLDLDFIVKLDQAIQRKYLHTKNITMGGDKISMSLGIEKSQVFGSCDLDFGPMTFIYELDLYPLKIHLQTKNKLSSPKHSKFIVLHIYDTK